MTERTENKLLIPDLEREDEILFPGQDIYTSQGYNNRLIIEGFLEGNSGRVFTVSEMVDELPFTVDADTCHNILRQCIFAERLTKKNKSVRYVSKAPGLDPTFRDIDGYDQLGEQARADFYELVRVRSLNIKKKFRVINRF